MDPGILGTFGVAGTSLSDGSAKDELQLLAEGGRILAASGGIFVVTMTWLRWRRPWGRHPSEARRAAIYFAPYLVPLLRDRSGSLWLALPALDFEKSPRALAEIAARVAPGHSAIGVFDHNALAGGLDITRDAKSSRLRSRMKFGRSSTKAVRPSS